MTIRLAVGQVQGVGKVGGDVKARTLTVEYEPSQVTVGAIQQVLGAVGYDATVVT